MFLSAADCRGVVSYRLSKCPVPHSTRARQREVEYTNLENCRLIVVRDLTLNPTSYFDLSVFFFVLFLLLEVLSDDAPFSVPAAEDMK